MLKAVKTSQSCQTSTLTESESHLSNFTLPSAETVAVT